jgi:hypothetical protein
MASFSTSLTTAGWAPKSEPGTQLGHGLLTTGVPPIAADFLHGTKSAESGHIGIHHRIPRRAAVICQTAASLVRLM